ncbi:MAG: phage tail sheath C-terminal domain-containing protein [Synechococcales bacterium]|nr:phage tail sheath C-terminal domain-containing protein [Synechococcales bacterium]
MPVIPTYPGVYVEEIPSGVRTITGVATSITAFIGTALRGLTNEPVRIQNFGSFERQFGGLSLRSTMGYAVQQYFQNGGSDAIIVRLSNPGSPATVNLPAQGGGLVLESLAVGSAANSLKATVAHNGDANFNLTITPGEGNPETFENVAITDLENRLSATDNGSKLVRIKPGTALPEGRPNVVQDEKFEGGFDAAKTAQYHLPLPEAHPAGEQPAGEQPAGEQPAEEFLILQAASEGKWGNNLEISVDYDTAPGELFNLTVVYKENNQEVGRETLRNLSMDDTATRFVTDVVNTQSALIRVVELPASGERPAPVPDATKPDRKDPVKVHPGNQGTDGGNVPDDRFYVGSQSEKTGIYALEKADLFNILCIPPVTRTLDITPETWAAAAKYCSDRRAMLLVDPPIDWTTKELVLNSAAGVDNIRSTLADDKQNAAIYFPRLKIADPLKENRSEVFVPCGVVAGIFARTDAERGVWKAPAGIDAGLSGVRELTVKLTDDENGLLNPLGVNCLRSFPVYGNVVWGARTLDGADQLASEWKYVPVRRLALFLQESLYRGTQWVVFEPNDEPLWAQIRLNVGAFMNTLFKQGAFQGKSPREAYFVKCDSETTTQNDIDRGIVNIVIGYAPLKPAEFVILKFQQMAGQLAT